MSVAWGFLITRVADKNIIFHKVQQVSHARLVGLMILLTLSHIPQSGGIRIRLLLPDSPIKRNFLEKTFISPHGIDGMCRRSMSG